MLYKTKYNRSLGIAVSEADAIELRAELGRGFISFDGEYYRVLEHDPRSLKRIPTAGIAPNRTHSIDDVVGL